jgi:hypothetical protein
VDESLSFAESLELDSMKLSIGVRIYPNTEVARRAEKEGLLSSGQDLLFPKFYLARELEGWLYERVAAHMASKPTWTF